MLAFVPQRSLATAWRESDNSASAKSVSSLHANRQLGGEQAQVGADFVFQKPSQTVVTELTEPFREHAGDQQRCREPFREIAGAHPRPLLLHEFSDA
jgi:hypothetical protein